MSTTITSSHSHRWELLGQLALCSQAEDRQHDNLQDFVQHVVEVLQNYLVAPWGMLSVVTDGVVVAQSSWGVRTENRGDLSQQASEAVGNNAHNRTRFVLQHGADELGYLLLAPEDETGEASPQGFYAALTAQLSLLLAVQHEQMQPVSQPGASLNNHGHLEPTAPPYAQSLQTNETNDSESRVSQQHLALLRQVSQVMATNEENASIYRAIIEVLVQVLPADNAAMVVYEHKKGVAPVVAHRSADNGQVPFSFPLIDNPVIAWLDEHRVPFVSYDAQQDPLLDSLQDMLQLNNIHSVVITPLVAGGEVLGCIEMEFLQPLATVDEQTREFLGVVAAQAARVLENARLATQATANAHALEGKVGELSTLLEAARILGSLLRPDEVLNNLMDLVSRRLGVTTVALWTIGNDNYLTPAAMDGIPLEMAREMKVPIGNGLTGKVAETGVPLIVKNVLREGESLYPEFNRRNHLMSFMGVPIFYRERIIGVLSVMTSDEYEFSTDELMLLVGLAGQAAIALENARLFQERERRINELSTINSISSSVNSTLELDEMLYALHSGISEVIDTSHSFIALYDIGTTSQSPILRQRIARDGDVVHYSEAVIPLDGKGLIDYVVLEGKPLWFCTQEEIAEFYQQNIWISRYEAKPEEGLIDIASWLGVPIMLGDDILGIIAMKNYRPHIYSEDDMRFLSTIASHAAVAISNARLFSERERRLREITVLKDIGSAISSTLDLQGALERLYHELGQAIDMSTSLIGIYDYRTNILAYPVCYDQGQRIYLEPAPLYEGPSEWAIRNRQPLLLHTKEQAKQMGLSNFGFSVFDVRSGQSGIRHPRSREIQSAIATPIISSEAVLGIISIKSYHPYAFDEDDLRFIMTVANQLAVTITNIYMFQERERRIKELATFNEIGQELSATVSIDDLPALIYRQTSRLLDTTNFYVALFDETKGEISFPIFYEKGVSHSIEVVESPYEGVVNNGQIPINPGLYKFILYLIRRVIYKRETLLLKGSDLDHVDMGNIDELQEEMGALSSSFPKPRSWLGVPMIAADKVLGVIGIQHYEDAHAYGDYDAHLLSTIASWSAIALENAYLFEQISNLATSLEQRVAERTLELERANRQLLQEKDYLETIHSVTLELTATLNLDTIINRALEVASTNLDVSRGSIMLRELQGGSLVCRAVLQDQGIVQSADVPIAFERGEGLSGWVMQNQVPVCIDDVRNDQRWLVEPGRADDVRSVAAAPLMTGDTTLGVLILTSPEVEYFSESQLRLLATIANEVAIAINNAQLYSYINEMATRLADLLEQQKEENTKSRAILQSLTEGVIVLDEDDYIQLINWAAEDMLNISAQDILQQPLQVLDTYGDTEAQYRRASVLYSFLLKGLEKVRDQQSTYTMSMEFPSPAQTIAMNVAKVMDRDGRRYGNVAVMRDVTREIESDRAKREFISNVSHELRTPLTSIKGYIDVLLLQSMGPLNENQMHFLNVVKTNSNRLMDLINDILIISRIESGKIKLQFKLVDIKEVILDVVQSLKLEADGKNLSVTMEIAEGLPLFKADEKRLTQIVFNLFSNAVKYTFEGGRIVVRAFLNPAQMVQVEVEDTGVGMTPEQCEKLFRPFYRADNPLREIAGGTGLGLSITKSLVEQHGGEMWVTSEQDKGSTFSFIMPLEQPERSEDEADGDDE